MEVETTSDSVPFYRGAAAQKLVVWLIFGVICSLFPIGADYISASAADSNVGLIDVLSHGELLIVSAVMAAAAVGDIVLAIAHDPKRRIMTKLISLGACTVFFGITCIGTAARNALLRARPRQLG